MLKINSIIKIHKDKSKDNENTNIKKKEFTSNFDEILKKEEDKLRKE